MGERTAIAWTDHTFSSWWGCTKISAGCTFCYASTFSERVGHGKRLPTIWGPNAERRFFGNKHWAEPLKWNRNAARDGVRRRVFCASMADVFEDRRDLDPVRVRLGRLIIATPLLDWLLLTKRADCVARLAAPMWDEWPPNVWLGVTAEDQAHYDARWPHIARIHAAVRFVSHEPALGPLEITAAEIREPGYSALIFPDWVITGGESGPHARPYRLEWARRLVRATRETPVSLFVKQLGARPIAETGADSEPYVWAGKADDPEQWPHDLRVREFPLPVNPRISAEAPHG